MNYKNWGSRTPPLLSVCYSKGYKVFDGDRDYDLNLIGVRSESRVAGNFDDRFYVIYQELGQWIQEDYECTTDPSAEQHLNPTHEQGVAILKPGQYRGVWKLDMHAGKYLALCQRGSVVTVYRDRNRDRVADYVNEDTGWFGINCHRAHPYKLVSSTRYYSAGCQVIRSPVDFARLLSLCTLQAENGLGDTYTYTLLHNRV